MPIEVHCANANCKRRNRFPSDAAGKSVRCRACGETFIAGKSSTVEAQPAKPNPRDYDFEPAWDPVPSRASTSPPPPPTLNPVGSTVGRFVIRGPLGSGAFGTVYRAYDPQLDRVVALKVPNPGVMSDQKRVERFLREAKAAAALRHPHIVPVFDAGQDGDRYYIACAFVDGAPLSEGIPEHGVEFPRAVRIVRELAEALAYAHEQGIVHRDVKSQNVMIDKLDRVHLMDFGLASRQDEAARLTNDGAVMGTPAYMAPEQAAGQKGEVQPAADQYAVGVVLYELLTGRVPFAGPLAVVIHNAIHTNPEPPHAFRPDVPKDLETICLKAMSKRPEDRYPDCQALADDLRRWHEGEPITARRMGSRERAVRWVRKKPKLAGAAVAVALLMFVSVGWAVSATRRANRAEREATEARAALKGFEGVPPEAPRPPEEPNPDGVPGPPDVNPELETARNLRRLLTEERAKTKILQAQAADERKNAEVSQAKLRLAGRGVIKAALHAYSTGAPDDALALLRSVPMEGRGWEWWHVHKLCAPSADDPPVLLLKKPGGSSVNSALFGSNGAHVLTASDDKTARLWDAKTGAELRRFEGHTDWVNSAALSPDGAWIVTGSDDKTARLWDAKTGKELLRFEGQTAAVKSVAFNHDGTRVVTAGADGTAHLWDAKTGAELSVCRGHRDWVRVAVFSPDGKWVLTTSDDKTARLWDAKTGSELRPLKGHTGYVKSAAFNPDATRIATGSTDDTVRVWDAKSGEPLFVLKGHTSVVTSVAFSPDGSRIVTGSDDRTWRVWDAKSGEPLLNLRCPAGVRSVVWSPDGSKLLLALEEAIEIRDGGPPAPKP